MGRPDASVPVLIPVLEQQDISPTALVERVPARIAVRLLSLKTATLAQRRQRGHGPKGWIYLSESWSCIRSPRSKSS
jgi:hypothetical protein